MGLQLDIRVPRRDWFDSSDFLEVGHQELKNGHHLTLEQVRQKKKSHTKGPQMKKYGKPCIIALKYYEQYFIISFVQKRKESQKLF